MDFRGTRLHILDWIQLAQERIQLQTFVNKVMKVLGH
jgi:hypothetical protein